MITIEEKKNKKIPGSSSLFITFNYNKELVDTLKSCVSVANYDKKDFSWEVPVTDLASIVSNLVYFDEINLKLLKDKKSKPLKEVELDLKKFKTKPFKYQEEGIKYGLTHDSWLLLDVPGLGKTLQAIYIAEELHRREGIKHCLIICGVNTLKFNWKKEISRHSKLDCHILGERVNKKGRTVIGSVQDRINDLKSSIKEFFIVTNVETIRNNDIVKELLKGKNQIDMIVVDEAHCAKTPTSQQSKNLLKLTKARYRIAMTGTLLTNNPLDLYVPLKWIGQENCTFTNFKYYYCNYGGIFNSELIGYRNLGVLKSQLAQCSLRRTKDLLDLPPKTIIPEIIEMNTQQANFYNNIKQGIIDQVDKVHMSTANLLAMVARLRQATECPSVLTTENIKSEKVERAVDLVEQIISNNEKVVVFSTFKETLNILMDKLKDYKPLLCTGDVKDEVISSNIDMFQKDNEHKIILATTAKIGTGVTLHRASHAIFISTPWTSAGFQQCQDRIHRIGSKDPVFIHYFVCNETIDQRVEELVNDKAAMSDYVIDDQMDNRTIENLKKYIMELN